jgi:hypothetical protein
MDYTNPKILDMLKERIETNRLLGLIGERKKKGETSDKILKTIENMASKREGMEFDELIIDMDLGFRTMMEFEIENNSSSLAKDVRLILPGDGVAEIVEHMGGKPPKKIDWSDQLPLGDIRPKAKLGAKVWPKSMILASFNLTNPAIVHSGGTGRVMEAHRFYGRGADLAEWFIVRGLIFQVISASVVLTIIVMIIWFALRRGYIVIRPTKRP